MAIIDLVVFVVIVPETKHRSLPETMPSDAAMAMSWCRAPEHDVDDDIVEDTLDAQHFNNTESEDIATLVKREVVEINGHA